MRLLGCAGQSLKVLVGAGAMLLLAGSSHLSAQSDQSERRIGIPWIFRVAERSGEAATRPGPQGGNVPPLATEGG